MTSRYRDMIFWKNTTAPLTRHLGFFRKMVPPQRAEPYWERLQTWKPCSYRLLMVLISNFEVSNEIRECVRELWSRATVARDLKIGCSISWSAYHVLLDELSSLAPLNWIIWDFFEELLSKQNFEQPLLENLLLWFECLLSHILYKPCLIECKKPHQNLSTSYRDLAWPWKNTTAGGTFFALTRLTPKCLIYNFASLNSILATTRAGAAGLSNSEKNNLFSSHGQEN